MIPTYLNNNLNLYDSDMILSSKKSDVVNLNPNSHSTEIGRGCRTSANPLTQDVTSVSVSLNHYGNCFIFSSLELV